MDQVNDAAYKNVYFHGRDAIICSDATGLIKLWNPAAEQMFGYRETEALEQPLTILMPAAEQKKHVAMFSRLVNAGRPHLSEKYVQVVAQRKDGTTFPTELSLSLIRTAHGWDVVAMLRDVTERIQKNEVLKQYEHQLAASNKLGMYALAGMEIDELSQKITEHIAETLNVKYCKILQRQSDDNALLLCAGVGWKQGLVGHAMVGAELESQAGYTLKSEHPVIVKDLRTETRFSGPSLLYDHGIISGISVMIGDIERPWGVLGVHTAVYRLFSEDDICFIQTVANILALAIERKQAEMSIYKLSSAVEQAGESIMITDTDGVIEYVNPAFTKITGYTAEEAIGQTPGMLNSGSQDAAFYENMWKTITSGKVWHDKVIDKKKDGSFYPAMLTISPVHNGKGDISYYTAFIGIHSDLSELESLEKQFQQAQKMEAIGTLVGGIAHDFNNMLAGIIGNLYLIKNKVQEMPDVAKKLSRIESSAFRASDMVKKLLTFARKDIVRKKNVALTPFVKETLKFLRVSVPENIERYSDICSDDLQIKGDVNQLHQVLMNLINNARDALEGVENPRIDIRLAPFHPDDVFMLTHRYFKADEHYAHLRVGDNGCGMSKKQVEHIFEPFYTTKEVGKGTGLGLAMVYGAIKTHDGFIEVDSEKGKGTTFHLYLPLIEQDEASFASAQKKHSIEGRGELILLADDEPYVRETCAEVLEAMGYRVLQASDGLEVMEIFEADKGNIVLAILDVVMPHVGGKQLAERIRQVKPDMPIIFVTGYDIEHTLNGDACMPNSEILTKPVQFEVLSHSIRKFLD